VSRRPPKKSSSLTFNELRREISSGQIAPLYLFAGEERYLHERALQLLYDTIDESLRLFNITVITVGADNGTGIKTTAAIAIDAANQMPMMSARRIVIVRDFDKIKEDEQDLVLAYLSNPSPAATVVFQAAAPDKRRKLTTALVKSCVVVTLDPLDEAHATRWAEDYIKELGCKIEPAALRMLTNLIGTGLSRLSNEIEKLAAYSSGGVIDTAAVEELVPRARSHVSWELWDAIISRDRKRAVKLMNRLLDDQDPLPILGSLASYYRRLLIGKELVESGASNDEIKRATGQWSSNFFSGLRRTPRAEFVRGLRRIAEVDNAIKNSEATPRLLMEYLIIELTLQNPANRSPRPS
jgi:DNA polymerase III subunit delta